MVDPEGLDSVGSMDHSFFIFLSDDYKDQLIILAAVSP